MSEQEIIKTLSVLLGVAEDATRGYYEAAQHVADSRLKAILLDCSFESARALTELQNSIDALSRGTDARTPSAGVSRDRFGADFPAAGTDQALRDAVLRDQARAAEMCAEALHQHLPKPVRRVVYRQRRGVLLGWRLVHELTPRRIGNGGPAVRFSKPGHTEH